MSLIAARFFARIKKVRLTPNDHSRRVLALLRDFQFAGRIVGRMPEGDRFNLERVERAGLGRDALLPDDPERGGA